MRRVCVCVEGTRGFFHTWNFLRNAKKEVCAPHSCAARKRTGSRGGGLLLIARFVGRLNLLVARFVGRLSVLRVLPPRLLLRLLRLLLLLVARLVARLNLRVRFWVREVKLRAVERARRCKSTPAGWRG